MRSMTLLSSLAIPLYVADGGSPPEFQKWLERLPNVALHRVKGLVPQVRWSLAAAAGQAEWVLYTEPDKAEFFENGLQSLLRAAEGDAHARLFVPGRTPDSFRTFPEGQRIVEQSFNQMAAGLLGTDPADILYGPMLLYRDLLKVLASVPDDAGWGWRIYLYAQAHLSGHAIRILHGNHDCPSDQRSEDDAQGRAYRLQQLVQNTNSLRQALLD